LPGCVATGGTVKNAEREIREAICFHIDGLKQDVRRCRSRPALPIMVRRNETAAAPPRQGADNAAAKQLLCHQKTPELSPRG
jgi:hypothetical protein